MCATFAAPARVAQRPIHSIRSQTLWFRQNVRICVHRDTDVRVTHAFHHVESIRTSKRSILRESAIAPDAGRLSSPLKIKVSPVQIRPSAVVAL